MAVSLRIILSAVIGLVAVVTAIIAFTPMYLVGLSSVQDTLGALRASIVARSRENLQVFVSQPFRLLTTVQDASYYGLFDASNASSALQMACSLAVANADFLAMASFLIFPWTQMLCDTKSFAGSLFIAQLVPDAINNGSLYSVGNGSYNALTRRYVPTPVPAVPYEVPVQKLYKDVPNFLQTGTVLPIAVGLVAPQIAAGAPLFNSTGDVIGVFRAEVRSDQVGAFLHTLGLRSRARALVLDRTNGVIVGLSWDETTWVGGYSFALRTNNISMKTIGNLTDPLIRRVLLSLGNATIIDTPAPFSTVLGTGEDRVYVDMVDVVRDRLLLRLLLAIPEIDFMADVYAKRSATLGGIAGAVVVLLLLGVVFAHLLTAPLARVSDRMYATATFEDNEEDDPPSVISEVREMQNAYGLMRVELNRTKAYLPQTLFRKDDDDTSDAESATVTDAPLAVRSVSGGTTKSATTNASSSSTKARARRTAGLAGATAAGALNTGMGTTRKAVSVLVINMVGTHDYIAAAGLRFEGAHGRVVNAVAAAVREQKGVLDTFHGDRFVATFNAANNIVAHSRRAAMAALAVYAEVHKLKEFNVPTMGVASGAAHVGNMGSAAMMRFCTIGPVFNEAVALERMCKTYINGEERVWSLCVGAVARDAELELNVQFVDVVELLGQRQILVSLESAKSAANDEWMYQLQQGEANNPFAAINSAMQVVFSSSAAEASAKVADAVRAMPAPMRSFAGYRSLTRILASA